jgi:hypothetical protein
VYFSSNKTVCFYSLIAELKAVAAVTPESFFKSLFANLPSTDAHFEKKNP